MLETSARLLRLLSLLQTRRDWSGAELAERLGDHPRTVRRDVERLRELGYPVDATPGVAGGYRLGAGASLPPLLLDDEEAVAVAVGLRTAAGGSVAGIEETSLRALTKLEQVLPSRLRHRVDTLHIGDRPGRRHRARGGPGHADGRSPTPAATTNGCASTTPAHAARDTLRSVEPHSLVSFGRHWYLVAWDTDRDDWRTFRVDRLGRAPRPARASRPGTPRRRRRDLPGTPALLTNLAVPGDRHAARVRRSRGRQGVAGHGRRRGRRRSQLPAARRRRNAVRHWSG